MFRAYACRGGKLTETTELASATWIDIVDPTTDEAALVTRATGLALPTKAEITEIESSSRLAAADKVLTLSMPLVHMVPGATEAAPLGIVLSPERLVTVRFAPSQVFDTLTSRLHDPAEPHGAGVLLGLLEALVDRQADALEQMSGEVDHLSARIFRLRLSPDGRHAGAQRRQQEGELREMVQALGRLYNSVSLVRDSQLGIGRIAPYVASVADWLPGEMQARLQTVSRDVGSLNEFLTHLTDKIQFVLDATLGLINIAQNDLMKVLTIVSVIGIPPTLVAGIYGMNFVNIPELHWKYGYAYGLAVIALTAVLPLFWFRKKGWL
ncbi:MAG: magnesium transporter CorA family protein [Acidiphilium sp.]